MLTLNPEVVALTFIATQLIMSLIISDYLITALSLAVTAYIGYEYGGSKFKFDVSTVSKITTELGKYYFKNQVEDIEKDINEYQKKQNKIADEIQKLKRNSLYFPIDATNTYYDLQFSMLYEFNDLYYNVANDINYIEFGFHYFYLVKKKQLTLNVLGKSSF